MTIVQGDHGYAIPFIAKKDAVLDLTGATVEVAIERGGDTINKTAVIVDAISGQCEVILSSNDLRFQGTYTYQWTAYFPDGKIFSGNPTSFFVKNKLKDFAPGESEETVVVPFARTEELDALEGRMTTLEGSQTVVADSAINGNITINDIEVMVYDESGVLQRLEALESSTGTTVTASTTNGNLTVDGTEITVYDDSQTQEDITSLTSQMAQIAISVTQFGAKFDNTTDDIIAINETIAHVRSLGGGTVLLPRGFAKISAPIQHKSEVIIKGNGRDATFIVPTFDEGNVVEGGTSHKQKARIEDLTIKPESYKNKLVGINYKYFQYGSVRRVDVWRCGIGYYLDGSAGCYYNKQIETRAISCGWALRTITFDSSARPNANEVDDLTVLSPIIAVYHGSGNSNLIRNVKVESLEQFVPHPTVDYDGNTCGTHDRWVLKIGSGLASNFEKFRAEFDGNLVDLAGTYGHYLRDFYCNFNGEKDEYIELRETPSSPWQTNNLIDLELGSGLPVLRHTYFHRHSRLGQTIQLPPQIQMTPRDTTGAPSSGKQGLIRMDANGDMWIAKSDDTFEKVFYDKTSDVSTRGPVRYQKTTKSVEEKVISAKGAFSIGFSMAGLFQNANVNVSLNVALPIGLVVSPPRVDHMTFNVTVYLYNATDQDITLPASTWTAAFVRP